MVCNEDVEKRSVCGVAGQETDYDKPENNGKAFQTTETRQQKGLFRQRRLGTWILQLRWAVILDGMHARDALPADERTEMFEYEQSKRCGICQQTPGRVEGGEERAYGDARHEQQRMAVKFSTQMVSR